tara:strand:- start:534 stop:770 length:237 start_codon:yes stop_codon:yes gene_type:complete
MSNQTPFLLQKLDQIQMRQAALFQGLQELKRENQLLKKRINSIIDETNEVSTISEVVSRLNILENKLTTTNLHNIELS